MATKHPNRTQPQAGASETPFNPCNHGDAKSRRGSSGAARGQLLNEMTNASGALCRIAGAPSLARRRGTLSGPTSGCSLSRIRSSAPLGSVQRARAAHVTVQRAVVAVTQEAIRVCGGPAFLKRYPLERYARDARSAALMRSWTQEIATQQAWEAALGLDGERGRAAGA
jgi:hypothetical protein